jgi:hypothetical protein
MRAAERAARRDVVDVSRGQRTGDDENLPRKLVRARGVGARGGDASGRVAADRCGARRGVARALAHCVEFRTSLRVFARVVMRESCACCVVLCFGARLTTMVTVVGDGVGQIISDYCPKAMRGPTRAATLALTVATLVGLFQLNTKGEGVTRAVKSLWKA